MLFEKNKTTKRRKKKGINKSRMIRKMNKKYSKSILISIIF